MNILVTGGAGYIGSHVCIKLQELSHRAIVIDTLERGHKKAIHADEFIRGSIADSELVEQVLIRNKVDAVMHFSAYAYVEESMKNPAIYFQNNISATINLLDSMRNTGINKFVFSSSCATYGQVDVMPITEDYPQNPINPYGFTKLAVEKILEAYMDAYGLRFAVLRYFNAAGCDPNGMVGEDHRPETHIIPLLLDAALGRIPKFKVFGTDFDTPDGSCVRDYIHVTDLADAHIRALDKLNESKQDKLILNLGSNNGFSVFELVNAVKRITGRDFNVDICARRIGDPTILIGANANAKKVLGWTPIHSSLDEIIETAWKWKLLHPNGYPD